MGECLDEALLISLLRGTLDAGVRTAVDAHLAECAACRERLAQISGSITSSAEVPADAEAATALRPRAEIRALQEKGRRAQDLERGAALGRYVILDRLGEGAMGVVFAAYNPELDRKVAIKLILADGGKGDEALRLRLRREAQAMARLSHPNVVAVHDVGTFEGQIFIALEFVAGGTLREWMKAKPRSWQEIVKVFLGAGRGLAAAHAAGVVHRDFKPDNVLIGADGVVRVTDFGVAHVIAGDRPPEELPPEATPSPDRSEAGTLTRAGTMVGSPAYMSPEQILAKPTDGQSDLFGFCVALFEALYGVRPFAGKNVTERLPLMARGDVLDPTPPRPVPRWLRRVLQKGLRYEPAERYADMEALLRALEYDPARARIRIGGAALLAALALGAAVFHQRSLRAQGQVCQGMEQRLANVWDPMHRAAVQRALEPEAWKSVEPALDAYTAGWVTMRTQACEASRIRGEQSGELMDLRMECLDGRLRELGALIAVLSKADATVSAHAVQAVRSLAKLDDCANAALLRAPVRPPADPVVRAQIDAIRGRIADARALFSAGKFPEGAKVAQQAATAAEPIPYRPVQAEALARLGALQLETDDVKGAEQSLHRGALAAEIGRRDDLAAECYARLIYIVGFTENRPDEGLRWSEHAAAAIERMGGSDELEALRLQMTAATLNKVGRPAEARPLFERAIPLYEKVFGADSPRVGHALEGLAIAHMNLDDPEGALPVLQRAQVIFERELGPEHPYTARGLTNQGSALVQLDRFAEALPVLERAVHILEKAGSLQTGMGAAALVDVGDAQLGLGHPDEARAAYQRSADIYEKVYGPKHPALATPLTALGRLLGDARILERALALRTDPEDRAETAVALAEVLRSANPARARALAETSRQALVADPSPSAKKLLARAQVILGR